MALAEEPSSDPTASTRWSYRDPSDPPLADDPSRPFCASHAATIARLTRRTFGPHPIGYPTDLPLSLRDWHFGKLDDVLARRTWCRACALVSNAVDTVAYSAEAEVIACWVWDGVLTSEHGIPKDNAGDTATLRLRIAPEMVGWESSFEPIDLVPLDISMSATEKSIFAGRPVIADHFDIELVESWIKNCTKWHGSECVGVTKWQTSEWGVPFIRLISLAENKLIESASPPPYAALSYVWGSAPVFQILQDNIDSLLKPGGLLSQSFPKSIRDAISLARALHFNYLWIDSICIIQDSSSDKYQQISIMDGIYSRASLSIVAAAGADANTGIPGLESGSRSLLQHTVQISDDLTLVALHPDSHRSVAETSWNTRGWTYQERLLSRRCLFSFPDGTVGFQCTKAVWGEDYRAETPYLVRCAPMMDVSLNRSWMNPGGIRERGSSNVRTRRTPYLQEYSRLVEEYTGRKMTFVGDRLLGINGVLDVLRKEFNLRFIQGLPLAIIHMALLWQPRNRLKRVPKNEKTGLPRFPSWSWGGWIGSVGYENWNEYNGLPELEERARRVIPFSKLGIMGSTHLESVLTSLAEGELSAGWSKVSTASDGICYVFSNRVETYHSIPFISTIIPGPSEVVPISQSTGLRLRTRVARFRLTNSIRGIDMNRESAAIERRGRFGLAAPSPATSDEPWLGTILLPIPAQYHSRLAQDYEFIILSESYGFSRQELGLSFASKLQPYDVFDVMMIRRVTGDELENYRAYFLHETASSTTDINPNSWHMENTVVERVGVGRMLKSAWEGSDAWDDFVLV
ncbi:HET-domain-containing protein [Hypoxylon fuscum]|nr:HET-domain-containing protein [Hypoxylon fuscum]